MSEESRYRLRRADRVRIVDVVGREEPPAPARPGVAAGPRRVPSGSTPALTPPIHDFELDELAAPTQELTTLTVGGHTIVIERHDGRVTLSLPGAVRLMGSIEEAERLAAALAEAAVRARR